MQSFPMTSLERTKSRTWSLSLASKRKKGARGAGLRIADECQSACIRQLGVAKQMADDGLRQRVDLRGHPWARIRSCRADYLKVLPLRFNVMLTVHTFSSVEPPHSKICDRD